MCELWGGSTKHPDSIYTMNSQIKQGLFVRSFLSDSIEEDLSTFCQKIRALTFNFRPVIIALSKSADYLDRIYSKIE